MTGTPRSPWTTEQDKELQALIFSASRVETIAQALHRTPSSLRKAPPTLKVRTSFSIVASGATELSACASFAEVEMRRPEGEREMSGYLKQKLFQALHDLVGAGDLDQRLTHSGNYLAHLQDHEVPEEHRKELGEIKAIMFATPLSSERGYSPREISTEDGAKLAHRILELYTRVLGGL